MKAIAVLCCLALTTGWVSTPQGPRGIPRHKYESDESRAGVAPDLVLVERAAGVEAAPICIPTNATPRTREAAATLADTIEKIGGARLPIIDGVLLPVPARAIWVGVQPAVTSLFPQVNCFDKVKQV